MFCWNKKEKPKAVWTCKLRHQRLRGFCLSSCGRRPVVAQHDVERAGKVVGEGATVAFIHEGQQEGCEEQQGEEEEPQQESHAAHPRQQPRLLNTHTHTHNNWAGPQTQNQGQLLLLILPPSSDDEDWNNSPGKIWVQDSTMVSENQI